MSDNKSKQVAKNTIYLYIRMILVMAVSLYTSRVVLQVLGIEDFGIYNVVGSVVVFLSFLQAALRNATFRYFTYDLGAGNTDSLGKTYSMAINTHMLMALVLFLLMEIGGIWFINCKMNVVPERLYAANWAFQFSLLTFCISVIRTPFESNILAHERMDFYAITSVAEVFLRLGIVYLLLVIPLDKLIVYGGLTMLVYFSLFLFYVIFCHYIFKEIRYTKYWDIRILRQFASYSGWSLLVNAACITRSQCINIFFNLFLGVLANAAMGIANQVVGALNTFVTNFTQAFRPQLIMSWASKEYDYFMRVIFSTSKMAYFLLLIISIPVACNIKFWLKIWLGEYPEMAQIYIISIILYYLIDAIQEPLVTSVHATGRLKYHQIMISTLVFLFIPISYFMLKFGVAGEWVLISNALLNLTCATARTLYMRNLINLDLHAYFSKVVLPVICVTVISLPLPIYLTRVFEANWTNAILQTLLSMAITTVLCFFVGLSKSERNMVYSFPIVKKILGK